MVNHYLYRFADKYLKLWLIIGFAFFLLGGGVLGAVYFDYTPTETEQLTETKTETFSMDAQATSTARESSRFFDEGDTITGPIHFVKPNGTFEITQTFKSEREATVDNNIYVRINGTRDGWNFWNEQFVVSDESIQVNGTETVSNTVNISEYRERSMQVREAYERQGIITVDIIVESDYSTDIYSGSLTNSSRIMFRQNTYTIIPPNLSDSDPNSYSTVVDTQRTENSLYINAGFALIGVGLLSVLIRVLLSDPSRVKKDYMLMQFSEWISVADSEKTDISDKPTKICLSSCEDIIDVAADSRSRAIFIEDENKIITLEEDTVYFYKVTEEDEKPVRFSLFGSNDGESDTENPDTNDDDNDTNNTKNKNDTKQDESESESEDNSEGSRFMFTD